MGRAIDMENRQDDLERRLKLVEDVEVKADKEFRAPVAVRRKRKKAEATT